MRGVLTDPGAFRAVCVHEAAHAGVALALGLTVEEVDVAGMLRADDATAGLYDLPIVDEFVTGGTRIPDAFLDSHPREVLAAMCAPSCITTGVPAIDGYGREEAKIALEVARERCLDPDEVTAVARNTVAAQRASIAALATLLERDGAWRPGAFARCGAEHAGMRDLKLEQGEPTWE